MRVTVPAKLTLIAATTTLAFAGVVVSGFVTGARQQEDLTKLERELVPKLVVGPRLEGLVTRMQRGMQDAVAARDLEALEGVDAIKGELAGAIASAHQVIQADDAAALRLALEDYYLLARDVSRRLIAEEAGEDLVNAAARMQDRQEHLKLVLERAVRFDQRALGASFAAIRTAGDNARATNVRVGVFALALVIVLAVWLSRTVVNAVGKLSSGFARYATGDFAHVISVATNDELGTIAAEANRMAESLRDHAEERSRADWLSVGRQQLADLLRGELDPQEAARLAVTYLVGRVDGVAGAAYLAEEDGTLRLAGHHGLSDRSAQPSPRLRLGEGLAGEALVRGEVTVINNPPVDYLKVSSGLGEGPALCLVFVPLERRTKVIGVIEIALFEKSSDRVVELLSSVREQLAVTLESATSQAVLKQVLAETQRQAERLATQEESLRQNNAELRAQQEKLQHANDELEAQRVALKDRNTALDAANREVQAKAEEVAKISSYKSQFLANMSHELRTPLNSMLLLSHLLSENEAANLTSKQVEYCQTIHAAGKDLMSLINQVLDLAKIEAGKQDVHLETVPLTDFGDRARRMFEHVATDKGLSFEVRVETGSQSFIGTDRKRVEQILINLVGNAIKFTERGGVTLRIFRPAADMTFRRADLSAANVVAFSVSDTGVGIESAAQDAVFLPFEQIESKTDRRYGGTGLGLAIARESATLLGGELGLTSALGRGSTFTLYLPSASDAALSQKGSDTTSPPPVRHRRMQQPLRQAAQLLIIEDDEVFAEQLADIARARNVVAVTARTGEEGLRLAREGRPKGIVLDVRLPDTDGWSVMERLRRDSSTHDIPVHFVSALDESERGFALGAVGYLTKPTTRSELHDVVTTLMTAPHDGGQRVLVVEDDASAAQSVARLLAADNVPSLRVGDAASALDALAREHFGCMLLDLGLPDVDGLHLLQVLRSRDDIETPPVIVYTGRSLTPEEVQRLESYAQAVVLKDGSSEQGLIDNVRLFIQQVKEPRAATLAPPVQVTSAEEGPAISLKGVRVLVIDDDMRTLYAISALLRSRGADVTAADGGQAALRILSNEPTFDCVLTDIMMPDMDGYETIRRIRQDARHQGLPIVALTANAMSGERERCLEAGANEYQAKPVDGPQVLRTIHACVTQA